MLFSKRSRNSGKLSGGSGPSRCGVTSSAGKNKRAGVDVLGKGAHDFRDCIGRECFRHAIVARSASRSEHLRLGESEFSRRRGFEQARNTRRIHGQANRAATFPRLARMWSIPDVQN